MTNVIPTFVPGRSAKLSCTSATGTICPPWSCIVLFLSATCEGFVWPEGCSGTIVRISQGWHDYEKGINADVAGTLLRATACRQSGREARRLGSAGRNRIAKCFGSLGRKETWPHRCVDNVHPAPRLARMERLHGLVAQELHRTREGGHEPAQLALPPAIRRESARPYPHERDARVYTASHALTLTPERTPGLRLPFPRSALLSSPLPSASRISSVASRETSADIAAPAAASGRPGKAETKPAPP